MEENLIAYLGVLQHLIPAHYFDIEIDISAPLEPPQPVRHNLEILFFFEPGFHFLGQIANHISVERRIFRDQHLSALGRFELTFAYVVYVPDDLLDRILLRRKIDEIITLRLFELKDRDRVTRLIIAAEQYGFVICDEVWAFSGAAVEGNIRR